MISMSSLVRSRIPKRCLVESFILGDEDKRFGIMMPNDFQPPVLGLIELAILLEDLLMHWRTISL